MKKTFLLLLLSIGSFAQISYKTSYKTISGKVLTIGDTLSIGIGSKANKEFAFIYHQTASTKLSIFVDKGEVGSQYSFQKIIIQDFKVKDNKTYIVFYKSKLGIKIIDIEPAIETKELIVK